MSVDLTCLHIMFLLSLGTTHGNYIGLATLFQIDQATLYADNELTNTQLTVYLLAEQN